MIKGVISWVELPIGKTPNENKGEADTGSIT